jgi:hypothetical protein
LDTVIRRVLAPIALAASILAALPAHGADRSLEFAVKATFLVKFATFVEWPPGSFESDTSTFNLCILGADPYGGRISQAATGQAVGRHPIVLRQIARAEARSNCHAMFISGSASQDVDDALKAVAGTPILTVTDSTLDAAAGVIHFVIANDHVTFDIDNVAAARNGIVISSKLLSLARKLTTAQRTGR